MKTESVILACLLWAAPGLAQQSTQEPPHSREAATPIIRVSSELVVLDVLVVNKKTSTGINNLVASVFVVTEDGEPQRIIYLSHDQLPLSVVFLFDLTETVRPILKHKVGLA